MNKYKKLVFGNNKRIYLYILNNPIENGVCGLIKSKQFSNIIGIHTPKIRLEERQYSFGSFYISSVNQQPMIEIANELYDKDWLNYACIFTIFHELGHYFYKHFNNFLKNKDELRISAINNDIVLESEIQADNFATKYLGKKRTLLAMDRLIDLINTFADEEDVNTHLAIKELTLRKKIILSNSK